MYARPSHVQKARPIEAKIKIAGKKPLCIRYVKLLRLRRKVLGTHSAKPAQDDRLD